MVNLAYWSDFDTSRRDAASAFATLSLNDKNLDVLEKAGVLGGVLALIAREATAAGEGRSLSKASTDCLQDASQCLRRMLKRDEIKKRFLEAPGGLANVLALTASADVSLRQSAVRILDTLCAFPPAQSAVVREGGARVLVAQLASDNESLRRTAARVVRGLAGSPHTTPASFMDPDIVRFLLCLLEEREEPVEEQQEMLCIAYFTKVSSDEEACSQLADLGLSRYLISVLPKRRLSLLSRLSMLQALERMVHSNRCESRLIEEGLPSALIGLCFSEIASFVQGCEHYLRQRRDMGSALLREPGGSSSPSPSGELTATTDHGRKEEREGDRRGREGAGGEGRGVLPRSLNASSGDFWRADSFSPGPKGAKKKDDKNHQRFTEEKLAIAMDVARTCMSIFAYVVSRGHWRHILDAGILAYVNSVPIGDGDDPHMTGSLSKLVLGLSEAACQSECCEHGGGGGTQEDRLSLVAQGPLEAIMRCLAGGRAGQQRCALDALANVCFLPELKPFVFTQEVLAEVLMLAGVREHMAPTVIVLHQFSRLPEWRAPLVQGGCLELFVKAIAQAPEQETTGNLDGTPPLLAAAVAAIREITTTLDGAGRMLMEVGGLPHLLRLSRSRDAGIQRDALQALERTGHKSRGL